MWYGYMLRDAEIKKPCDNFQIVWKKHVPRDAANVSKKWHEIVDVGYATIVL